MRKSLKKTVSVLTAIAIIITTVTISISNLKVETNAAISNGIVFAKWDGTNGAVSWSNPTGATSTYNSDGSVTVGFSGNNGQPQCAVGLSFNNAIAQQALKIALAGSKKVEFSVTYTGGAYTSGTESLYNQLNTFLGSSSGTITTSSSNYLKIHRIVVDVSTLTETTTFTNKVLQIQAQNYGGSGFKDAEIVVSPITVVTDDTSNVGFSQSAVNFIKGIKVGWNLGNTLENVNSSYINQKTPNQIETLSGNNPVTTQNIINCVRAAGFNAIRLPVSWMMFVTEDDNGTVSINSAWIARIKEIIDYCYNADMYVIMDMHHDDKYWLDISLVDDEWTAVKSKYQQIWQIIANEFKSYNEKLIFEGANEVIKGSDWWGQTSDCFSKLNELMQIFVDTVRGTGGNNTYRYLMLPTYGAQFYWQQTSKVVIPNSDTRVIIDIHWYTTSTDTTSLASYFKNFYNSFVAKGVPVIMGECGLTAASSVSAKTLWAKAFMTTASDYGVKCFLWDDGGNFKMLTRSSLTWNSQPYLQAIMANTSSEKEFTVNDVEDQNYTGSAITPSISVSGLTNGTDYQVYYMNNTNVGIATIMIVGIGDYAGYGNTICFNIVDGVATTTTTGTTTTNTTTTVAPTTTTTKTTTTTTTTVSTSTTTTTTTTVPTIATTTIATTAAPTVTTATTTVAPTTTNTGSVEEHYESIFDAETATTLPTKSYQESLNIIDDTIRNDGLNSKILKVTRTGIYDGMTVSFFDDFSTIAQDSLGIRFFIAGDSNALLTNAVCLCVGSTDVEGTKTIYADASWGTPKNGTVTTNGTWYTYYWGSRAMSKASWYAANNRITMTGVASTDYVVDSDFLGGMDSIYIWLGGSSGSGYTGTSYYLDDVQFIKEGAEESTTDDPKDPYVYDIFDPITTTTTTTVAKNDPYAYDIFDPITTTTTTTTTQQDPTCLDIFD